MQVFCPSCLTMQTCKVEFTNMRSVYSLGKSYNLLSCPDCEIWITSPTPTENQLLTHYKSSYAFEVHRWVHSEKLRRARKLIALVNLVGVDTRVVEVGTGAGELASVVANITTKFQGCEIDEISCAEARKASGANILNIDAKKFLINLPKNSCDLLVFSHTLEHFLNPIEVLTLARRTLDYEGRILVVLPNREAAPRRLVKYWGYWQVPIHITHNNEASIRKLLLRSGFLVEDVFYRNSDFMALGSLITNLFKRDSKSGLVESRIIKHIVQIASYLYSFSYRFGKSDMIVVARVKNE